MAHESSTPVSVTVVVVGTGSIGTRHLEVLAEQAGVIPIAVSKRPGQSQKLAAQGQQVAADLSEASRMGATLAIIATETGQHLEDSLQALGHGLDLLVEKPLATNSQEAGRMDRCAKDAGRKIYVGCVLRFSESLNTFRSLLKEVGRLHSVRIECQSYMPDWQPGQPHHQSYRARANEGGVLLDLIHEIDYAGWLYGWPEALQAKVSNLGRLGIEADEVAHLMWESSEGYVVSISIDFLSRPSGRRMTAFGELGTISWDGIGGTITLELSGQTVRTISSSAPVNDMFRSQANAFVQTSFGIEDPRLAGGEDGVKSLAVCDAARRASDSKREEKVKYS